MFCSRKKIKTFIHKVFIRLFLYLFIVNITKLKKQNFF